MALTSNEPIAPGTPLPGFVLPDVVTGQPTSPETLAAPAGLLVMFLCRHCPYVIHVRPQLVQLAGDYLPRGIGMVGISANDATRYPDDAPARLAAMVREEGIPFALCHDESQSAARAFGAVCTPEFFLYDAARRLYYHGRLDDSTPGNGRPVTGADLRGALEALLAGEPAPETQHPSMGCSIKWR